MLKLYWLLALLCTVITAATQISPRKKIVKNLFADSAKIALAKADEADDLPIVALNENERAENTISFLPSLLTANRDAFISAAAFHFNISRFKMRGYDGQYSGTLINGISMNNPDDGNTQWGLWSGLNDVTRNAQMSFGLRPAEYSFGNIGNTVSIDMRAFKQRAQTQSSYSFSNRSYAHRWILSHSKGMNKEGWAFSVSGSLRYANEGYVAGTSYAGASYFAAVDKRLNENDILSLVFFGAATESGRQSPVLEESATLLNTHRYNSYWGYQDGKRRNANMSKGHQPVLLLILDHRINNQSSLVTTISGIAGAKSATALDWYKAADPRPDYYRYLPGYQPDSILRLAIADEIRNNIHLQQVNWDRLYHVNRISRETVTDANGINGNSFSGLRSHYIIEERIINLRRLTASTVYNSLPAQNILFAAGISLQWQASHYFKKVNDLLGGEFYVDWNQFAERDAGGSEEAIQNDLNRPNRILTAGDKYGYDYSVINHRSNAWAQLIHTKKWLDVFVAAELSLTGYLRQGNTRNGLFRFNSYGPSEPEEFMNAAVKAGITYKISGRKYLYLYAAVLSKAPLFDNVFISPRTRDTKQENVSSEKIQTTELGYVWNAPAIKMRLTCYLTRFADGMNVTTFYHDGYRAFMNYALSGIDKLHFGMELGGELKLSSRYTVNAAAAVGRYYYNSRQQVTVSADNDAYVIERGLIYSQNFRVGGTPQEAFNLGVAYQSSGSFYLNLSGNYFREQWLEFNPLRRTYNALQGLSPGTGQWEKVIRQTVLRAQYTVDLSAGNSVRLRLFGSAGKKTLLFNLTINNLLNNTGFISGGYEQLRFDTETKNVDKFPPKLFYAMGLNFSANLTLRL